MVSAVENPGKWRRKAVAITTRYNKEEEAGAWERLMKHMEQ